ncbi:hypothetical protein SBV1_1570017 [Verrucomicrobia bacterium]|nr:hypothetical protein SBV1_1570017 [Verrucomicrobiota bacterium]
MMGMTIMNTNEFKFYCSHCDQPLKGSCSRIQNVGADGSVTGSRTGPRPLIHHPLFRPVPASLNKGTP